jgi:V-type H+-transporting ATPase proteolipid subunit
MKSVVPVVMAGILGIYGMIVAVIIVQRSKFSYMQLAIPTPSNRGMPIWPQAFAAALARW